MTLRSFVSVGYFGFETEQLVNAVCRSKRLSECHDKICKNHKREEYLCHVVDESGELSLSQMPCVDTHTAELCDSDYAEIHYHEGNRVEYSRDLSYSHRACGYFINSISELPDFLILT